MPAFIFADAPGDFRPVIQGGELQNVHGAAGRAAFGVRDAVDDPGAADVDDGPGAHGARFLGHVERAIGEPPIAGGNLGLGDGQHFGVGGGVLEGLNLIGGAGDDALVPDDDAPDRDFVVGIRPGGLTQSLTHEEFVADAVDDWQFGGHAGTKAVQAPGAQGCRFIW